MPYAPGIPGIPYVPGQTDLNTLTDMIKAGGKGFLKLFGLEFGNSKMTEGTNENPYPAPANPNKNVSNKSSSNTNLSVNNVAMPAPAPPDPNKNKNDNKNKGSSNIKNTYNSIKDAPKYPDEFTAVQNGTKKFNINNNDVINELRQVEPGKWSKVYKDGYDAHGNKISIHYFESPSGKVFDVKVKPGWSVKY